MIHSKKPERIWAVFEPHESGKGHPVTYATAMQTKGTEYVRRDITERETAALRQLVENIHQRYNPGSSPFDVDAALAIKKEISHA